MERPRLLLVPMLTELEWVIKPLLDEWADVASYDAPGIGDEPPVDDFGSEAVARRGLEEADRRGWDSFVVVADEFGLAAASSLCVAAGSRVQGVAFGHARLSNSTEAPRPAVNLQVLLAIQSLVRTDQRTFAHQMFKLTGGEETEGGYKETLIEDYVRRVPMELAEPFYGDRISDGDQIGARLADLDAPMLFAEHSGCLMFTAEGFEDAVAAFPSARTTSFHEKPSTSPEFAALLRDFCDGVAAAPA